MTMNEITSRLKVYLITSILSILLTLAGFSYNVYRLQQSEINNNIRTSSFEMLKELANLQQIVYSSYYDKDTKLGSPRMGWVKVGVIQDLGIICFSNDKSKTDKLFLIWKNNWASMHNNENSVNNIINSVDNLRAEIRKVLRELN